MIWDSEMLSWQTIREFGHIRLDSIELIQQIQVKSRQRLANNKNTFVYATK